MTAESNTGPLRSGARNEVVRSGQRYVARASYEEGWIMDWEFGGGVILLKGRRVIEINDGNMTYYGALSKYQRLSSAVREFVETYDWNGLDEELARERNITREEALSQLQHELRTTMSVRIHIRFAGVE